MKLRVILSAALFGLCAATAGQAATLTATGATGVDVGGTFYDVSFQDGTCQSVFGGCDSVSDFTFITLSDANAASTALLNLFALPENQSFNDDPALTDGCGPTTNCSFYTPYAYYNAAETTLNVSSYQNFSQYYAGSDTAGGPYTFALTRNTSNEVATVWAVWSESSGTSPIPLPAGLPLLLTGLAGLAGLRRLRKKSTSVV